MSSPKFKSQERPGFSMTFENGWTISVQWHASAYCGRNKEALEVYFGHFSRHIRPTALDSQKEDSNPAESPNAEIAMWDDQGNWYPFGSDTVLGYQTPDQVAKWIELTKSFKPTKQ